MTVDQVLGFGWGFGFAVGCRLSYGPVLHSATCRASYELSLALVVAVGGTKSYVAALLGTLKPAGPYAARPPASLRSSGGRYAHGPTARAAQATLKHRRLPAQDGG